MAPPSPDVEFDMPPFARKHSGRARSGFTWLLVLTALGIYGFPDALRAQEKQEQKPPTEAPAKSSDVAGSEAIRQLIESFKGRGALTDPSAKPLSPEESRAAFVIPDDLQLNVFSREPELRQPLSITFDERGRMWAVQYLQYPFPAGLKVLRYDQYLRAVFDGVPQAPPNHVRGRDKLTIHADKDGDGYAEDTKTFVDGLNIATSCERGRGGVWVLNPPYLLFYPDRNHDDIPDGDPETHLSGFGLEDTHSVANSLRWGPDGWLYGGHGSTCWATVSSSVTKDVHFKGQAVWRYHPETHVFEIFAEGGGNTFGLEFDSLGRIYSGYNGGDARGFYFVQGGYYIKNWGKHGSLTNPYAFGYFPPMQHPPVPRFSHTFMIYEGNTFPAKYQGKLFAPVPLHNYVALSKLLPRGSGFATVDEEKVVTTPEKWFRPVDIRLGPDGGVYLADWYDTRLSHLDPRDTWDRAHGRIYRLQAKNAPKLADFNLAALSSVELVKQLEHPNRWFRETALRLLGDRRDRSLIPLLKKQLLEEKGQLALQSLWALNLSGGLDEASARDALRHDDPFVRMWTVRLLGDGKQVTPGLSARLAEMARTEPHPEVRGQLASSAKRLPGPDALPILAGLMFRDEDLDDPHIPLLVWWGLESKAVSERAAVLKLCATSAAWRAPLVQKYIQGRLAQRYAAEPTLDNQAALISLLNSAPSFAEKKILLEGINAAFSGQRLSKLNPELAALLTGDIRAPEQAEPVQVTLALRAGDPRVHAYVLKLVADEKQPAARRLAMLELLGQVGRPESAPVLLAIAIANGPANIRQAALSSVQRFPDETIARQLLLNYAKISQDQVLRSAVLEVLATRKTWTLALIEALQAKQLPTTDVPLELVARLALHHDERIDAAVRQLWGRLRPTPEEAQAQMLQVAALLQQGPGDPLAGKSLFLKTCAKCHRLHNEGERLGPDLTGYERDNLSFLLLAILDPSAAIREEYTSFQLATVDGLVLSGFVRERGEKTITMQVPDRGSIVIPKDDIEEGPIAMPISLMPERVLQGLSDQQVRDLFAYLRTKQPVK